MKKYSSLLAVAAAALLSSCGEDANEISSAKEPIAIEFVHTVAPISRLIGDIYTTKMPGSLNVGIFVADSEGNLVAENAKYKTAEGGAELSPYAGAQVYWPYEGDITTYSYAPHSASATLESIAHSVSADQENCYYDSDLVVAAGKTVQNKVYTDASADRSISLEYKHVLSQINVHIELLGPWIKYYKVEVPGLYSTCELNLKTGAVAAHTEEGDSTVSAYDYYQYNSHENNRTSHFIAVPQAVPAGKDFIVVYASDQSFMEVSSAEIKTYKFQLSSPLTLKSGKSYGFTLKLVPEQEAMGATCSLSQWTADDDWTPVTDTLTPQP